MNSLFSTVYFPAHFVFFPLALKKTSFAHYLQILKLQLLVNVSIINFLKRNNLQISIIWLTTWNEENKHKRNKTMNLWKLLNQCVTLSHVKWALLWNTRVLLILFLFIMTKCRHWKNMNSIVTLFLHTIYFKNSQYLRTHTISAWSYHTGIKWKEWYLFQVLS